MNLGSSYPYKATDTDSCKYNPSNVAATVTGFTMVPEGNEAQLMQALKSGPVSVAIDAGQASFQNYKSGIYNDKNCRAEEIDHAVLLVGYGVENGQKFWTVKNSWGKML